jgi:hypothetical protein
VYAKGIGVHSAKVYTIQDEAARILKNIEEQAYDLHDHALTLNAATGIQTLEREFFVEQMSAVRQDVNTMGAEITRLEALAESGSDVQRDAAAKAKPQLEAVAAETTAGGAATPCSLPAAGSPAGEERTAPGIRAVRAPAFSARRTNDGVPLQPEYSDQPQASRLGRLERVEIHHHCPHGAAHVVLEFARNPAPFHCAPGLRVRGYPRPEPALAAAPVCNN